MATRKKRASLTERYADKSKDEPALAETVEPEPTAEPEAENENPGSTLKTLAGLHVVSVAETIENLKILVYGDQGHGKTRLAGSASEVAAMSPVLFLDFEGGTKTIRNLFPEVDVIRIQDELEPRTGNVRKSAWSNLISVYEELKKGVPYRTIVVDSLTEVNILCMAVAKQQAADENDKEDPEVASQRTWGKGHERTRSFVRSLRNLPYHVIFTALDQRAKDEKSGRITITPSLPGKLASQIPAMMDEVFYLQAEMRDNEDTDEREIVRYMLTQPDGKHSAKDRSGRLPLYLENPTMTDIASLVLDNYED